METQAGYWDRVAEEKTFSHPLDWERLEPLLEPTSRLLDVGCGYGRTAAELHARGYERIVGVDPSAGMVARGRRVHPHLDLRVMERFPLPFGDGSFDGVFLLAVLTCVPGDEEQQAIFAEIRRLLRPGGVLYLSDLPLQDDARNRRRYEAHTDRHGTYGVFELPEGVVCRHHDMRWIARLAAGFEILHRARVRLLTMNGHDVTAFQWIARRSGEAG